MFWLIGKFLLTFSAQGNTEEELEEYTEIFENIEEYRGDSKRHKPIDDDDVIYTEFLTNINHS